MYAHGARKLFPVYFVSLFSLPIFHDGYKTVHYSTLCPVENLLAEKLTLFFCSHSSNSLYSTVVISVFVVGKLVYVTVDSTREPNYVDYGCTHRRPSELP